FSCVSTATTPCPAIAALVSSRAMRPLAIVAHTTLPWRRPATLWSAAYLAAPVTFARPSMRAVAVPMYRAMAVSGDLLAGLRLRCAACRLRQRADDGPARQLDLERVVRESPGVAQHEIGRGTERRLGRSLVPERCLGLGVAPRLVCDAA